MTRHALSLLSTNVAQLQAITKAKGRSSMTGIFKSPIDGLVAVAEAGLSGDHIGSTKYHGGPDQAVYIYSAQDYSWWEDVLERPLPFGTFGENLTVSSMGDEAPRVGDRWQIGKVMLQLTAPRIPCSTLAARMQDPAFVKKFAKANRGGAYARVLRPGVIEAGMEVTILDSGSEHPMIDELFAVWHRRDKDPDLLRRALASPLASMARQDVEKWLARQAAREGANTNGR